MLDMLRNLFREDQQTAEIDPALAAAALLFEVAWADHTISAEELAALKRVMQSQFEVDAEQLQQIIADTELVHESSVGVFPYTRAINEQLDQTAKIAIIRSMWQVAYADTTLDVFEEHTIRRIADLLYVSHKDFIATKLEVRKAR